MMDHTISLGLASLWLSILVFTLNTWHSLVRMIFGCKVNEKLDIGFPFSERSPDSRLCGTGMETDFHPARDYVLHKYLVNVFCSYNNNNNNYICEVSSKFLLLQYSNSSLSNIFILGSRLVQGRNPRRKLTMATFKPINR